jgi:glycosyltransferase involved in cell wall biosynthesis
MQPAVSVVIPVYNRAHSIAPTLQSVRAQRFTDFECLVVDDGSKDGDELRRVVESLGDPRFRYVRRDNGGASAARNTGVAEAKGGIIAFLDSDDRWMPDKLERDIEAGEKVVYSQVLVERSGRVREIRPRRALRAGEAMSEYLACHQGFVQTSTVALPRDLARRVPFDAQIAFGQDTDFAIRLAAAGAAFHMHGTPGVIFQDDLSNQRLSHRAQWKPVLEWLDRVRPLLTGRAYLAYRGWHVARLAAEAGRHGKALGFYAAALAKGALPPRLAAKALAQIFIRRSVYGRLRR